MPSPNQSVCKLSNPLPLELLQGIFRTSKKPHQLVSLIAILKTIAATLLWILWPCNTAPLLSEKSSTTTFSTFFLTEQPEQAEQGKPLMQFWQAQISTREIKTTQTNLLCLRLLCSPWWKISKQFAISEQTEWNYKIWRYFHSLGTPTTQRLLKGKDLIQHLHLQCQKRDLK